MPKAREQASGCCLTYVALYGLGVVAIGGGVLAHHLTGGEATGLLLVPPGISAGVSIFVAGVLALLLGEFFAWRRRRRRQG